MDALTTRKELSHLGTKTELLLVDDDATTLFINEKIIEKCNLFMPHKAFSNATDCLQYMEGKNTEDQNFILILDINMPRIDGWELLDLIKSKNFKSKALAIMATSSLNEEDEVKSKTYDSVIQFLVKPLTIESCEKLVKLPQILALHQHRVIQAT